jgi:hypothetical protein
MYLFGGVIMTGQHMLKASLFLVAGLLPFASDPPPVQADSTGPSAYNYRQEPGIPVEVSGTIKRIKEVAVHDTGMVKTGIENTIVLVQPDRGPEWHERWTGYGRYVDLGMNQEFRNLTPKDHLLIRGITTRINTLPVILAETVQINDGKTIEVSRDPAFKYGWMWGRPLRADDEYSFENINIGFAGPGRDWYFDSYEFVGYPFSELPPGASAPWARSNEASWRKLQEERRGDRINPSNGREAKQDSRDNVDRTDQR